MGLPIWESVYLRSLPMLINTRLFKDIYGPDYLLDEEKLPVNLLYAMLILQFLLGLYTFIRSSIILYEYKQGIRSEEDDEVLV